MTIFSTPEQEAESRYRSDEITIRARETRIVLLETLIQKYATHVGACEGVSFLESQYRYSGMGLGSADEFTDEEWVEIRRIAEEVE
jgi:hypothetical protein